VIARLARIEGHVRSIREMVEAGRDCSDVLVQVAAVRAAVEAVGRIVLEDHFETCILAAVRDGHHADAVEDFKEAFSKLVY
jgi:DNA-binding FrmR family transcriptional regulator